MTILYDIFDSRILNILPVIQYTRKSFCGKRSLYIGWLFSWFAIEEENNDVE